jgi:hypothetical protein
MVSQFELWTEALGALALAALLPFYMGYLHLSLLQLLLYTGLTALLLTAGEYLRFGGADAVSVSDVGRDVTLWAQLVLGLGLPSYLVALVAV